MKIKNSAISSPGPLTQKILKNIQKKGALFKCHFLGTVKASKLDSAEIKDLNLLHQRALLAVNLLIDLAALILDFSEVSKLTNILQRAEDLYVPNGPPMSPISRSFFTFWSLFDCSANSKSRETIGSTLYAITKSFGLSSTQLTTTEALLNSRMGLYTHVGFDGDKVLLREFITNKLYPCIVTSEYRGQSGKVWFVRVFAPLDPEGPQDFITLTTPYVFKSEDPRDWKAYFDRALPPQSSPDSRIAAYENLMKWGLDPTFWCEFIFEAYSDYITEAVFLEGFPDQPETRPHAPCNH